MLCLCWPQSKATVVFYICFPRCLIGTCWGRSGILGVYTPISLLAFFSPAFPSSSLFLSISSCLPRLAFHLQVSCLPDPYTFHLWIFRSCVVDTLLSAWILMLLSSEMGLHSVPLVFLREGGADLAPQWTNPEGEKPCSWEIAHLTMVSFDSKHSALATMFLELYLCDIC